MKAPHETAGLRGWFRHVPLLLVFYVLKEFCLNDGEPSGAAYSGPVLLAGALATPGFLVAAVIPSLLPVLYRSRLAWSSFPRGNALRWLIGFTCIVLAWAFSTYDYNLYFDRGHYLDRALLVALAFGVLLHPSLTPAFLAMLIAIVFQFTHPIGAFSWTDFILLIDVLMLFVVYLQFRALRMEPVSTFVSLTLLVTAAHYVAPGISKLQILWPARDDLSALAACCYMNGWATSLDEDFVLRVLGWVRALNPALLAGTIAIEVGAAFLPLIRRAYVVVLPACAMLHLGIYAVSGIFFWKWVLFEGALFVLLLRLDPAIRKEVFGRTCLRPLVFAVLTINLWLDPIQLTWLDTRLTYCFELEAVGDSGETYRVSRDFMAPYDKVFAQNRFSYLTERPVLVRTLGTTSDHALEKELRSATLEDIERLEASGESEFDGERAREFDDFVRRYFANLNRRGHKGTPLGWLAPPHHISYRSGGETYEMQEPIVEIRVVLERWYYRNDDLRQLSSETVRSIRVR